ALAGAYENCCQSLSRAREQERNLRLQLREKNEQRKSAFARVRRELRRGATDSAVQRRTFLHAAVRKQYSALRVMMDLMKLRCDREKHVVDACVADAVDAGEDPAGELDEAATGPSNLWLRVTSPVPQGTLEEGTHVQVHFPAKARPWKTKILNVRSRSRTIMIEVDLDPQPFLPGANVSVEVISRFGMWAQDRPCTTC
ncbi:MAG: hypothetical protein ACOC9Q_03635, partial [bacterium]